MRKNDTVLVKGKIRKKNECVLREVCLVTKLKFEKSHRHIGR